MVEQEYTAEQAPGAGVAELLHQWALCEQFPPLVVLTLLVVTLREGDMP